MANEPLFLTSDPIAAGANCGLDDNACRHLKVLRLDVGSRVGLRDGQGGVGTGRLIRLSKSHALVEVDAAAVVEPPPPVHLLVPVADRDRMLWLAEKSAEFGLTSWRPVLWRRSRSVAPRGEGITFQAKIRARMHGALEQSGGSWLPQLFPEATPERALLAAPPGTRLTLDPSGPPILALLDGQPPPVVIALGPEGGLEDDERDMLAAATFQSASLGGSVLRFETAGIAALAIVRNRVARSHPLPG